MTSAKNHLKVFLYHRNENFHAVQALRSRFAGDGVQVVLSDEGEGGQSQSADSRFHDVIQGNDVVLICISSGSTQDDALKEIRSVVDMATGKSQGDLFLFPIRFEECEMPASLKRWQAMNLYEQDGYEKLMLALKQRADRLGVVLESRSDWRVPLNWAAGKGELVQDEKDSRLVSFLTVSVGVLVIALLLLWGFPRILKAVSKTAVPVNVMIQNSTQSALERANSRSMSQTAIMEIVQAPLTQTAVMEETLQHPATPTIQFPTIIAMPTELIDPGNVRLVYVPGDNFMIGNEAGIAEENPAHLVYVKPFYIDKYEVTNVLYRLCVDAGVCDPPMSSSSSTRPVYYGNLEFNEYPVVNVTWSMAKQYCEWRGARLPTEAEWESAARSVDGRKYPWGDESACSFANFSDTSGACVSDTTVVGSYADGRSQYGALDMSGNVSEWVNSLYWVYPYLATDGREAPDTSGLRVVRGGSWASSPEQITTYYRLGIDPSAYDLYTGFRCAHNARQ